MDKEASHVMWKIRKVTRFWIQVSEWMLLAIKRRKPGKERA